MTEAWFLLVIILTTTDPRDFKIYAPNTDLPTAETCVDFMMETKERYSDNQHVVYAACYRSLLTK